MKTKNIFSEIPENLKDEIFQSIIEKENLKIERIISNGQTTPEDFWYDQNQNEFIILLKGKAKILFEENSEEVELNPGDYILIESHKKHKVTYTSKEETTIWLAIHFK